MPGDTLMAFNGKTLATWNEFNIQMADLQNTLQAYKEDNNKQEINRYSKITAVIKHAGATTPDTLRLTLDAENQIGIIKHNPVEDYQQHIVTREYGFFESFPAGIAHGWNVLSGYVNDLQYVFTADGAKSVGSFGTIGNLFPSQWDWLQFWNLTAFISLMLAFINILPIPALDGGHVLFLLYEVITRRKPSDKFMERAQLMGMWLLFGLMAFAIFNDLIRFVF